MICPLRIVTALALVFGCFALLAPSARAQSSCMDWSGAFATPGFDDPPHAFETFDDGSGPKLYAGGTFTKVNGIPCDHVAQWDGSNWTPVPSGPAGMTPQYIDDLRVWDDGSGAALYAIGSWTPIGGGSIAIVAKRVAGAWLPIGNGQGFAIGQGTKLAVYDDGSGAALYAGGTFQLVDGVSALRIAKWDGSTWSPLAGAIGGATGTVLCMAVYDNGTGAKLYVGGTFTVVDGVSNVNRIAAWNGSAWSTLTTGCNDWVRALAVYDDGNGAKLYVGGDFTNSGGQSSDKLARWNGA